MPVLLRSACWRSRPPSSDAAANFRKKKIGGGPIHSSGRIRRGARLRLSHARKRLKRMNAPHAFGASAGVLGVSLHRLRADAGRTASELRSSRRGVRFEESDEARLPLCSVKDKAAKAASPRRATGPIGAGRRVRPR
jgi:hypothetical protein